VSRKEGKKELSVRYSCARDVLQAATIYHICISINKTKISRHVRFHESHVSFAVTSIATTLLSPASSLGL